MFNCPAAQDTIRLDEAIVTRSLSAEEGEAPVQSSIVDAIFLAGGAAGIAGVASALAVGYRSMLHSRSADRHVRQRVSVTVANVATGERKSVDVDTDDPDGLANAVVLTVKETAQTRDEHHGRHAASTPC